MTGSQHIASDRETELLDAAYRYVLEHGLVGLSLRPLATAIGSSPRVLLFLFSSKEGLVRAVLRRARQDEVAALGDLRSADSTTRELWAWLAAPHHRRLLTLWLETYALSVSDPAGPWDDFAAQTVADWLDLLAVSLPPERATLTLAVLRGALLDLLATGDVDRTTRAVEAHLAA
ncbi:MAG: TetR family transcriptional regulator [Aeromicrobium sp.]|nr:TetR family transcriptional regulator [Aeromicrobium sp.]